MDWISAEASKFAKEAQSKLEAAAADALEQAKEINANASQYANEAAARLQQAEDLGESGGGEYGYRPLSTNESRPTVQNSSLGLLDEPTQPSLDSAQVPQDLRVESQAQLRRPGQDNSLSPSQSLSTKLATPSDSGASGERLLSSPKMPSALPPASITPENRDRRRLADEAPKRKSQGDLGPHETKERDQEEQMRARLEVQRMKQLIREAEEQRRSEGKQFESQLQELRNALDEKTTQCVEYQRQVRTLDANFRSALDSAKETEKLLSQSNTEKTELRKQLIELQRQMNQMASVSESSLEEQDNARRMESAWKKRLDESQQAMMDLREAKGRAESENTKLHTDLEQARAELAELRQKDELFGGLFSGSSDVAAGNVESTLYAELETKNEELRETEHRLEVMIAQYEELERQHFALRLRGPSDAEESSGGIAMRPATGVEQKATHADAEEGLLPRGDHHQAPPTSPSPSQVDPITAALAGALPKVVLPYLVIAYAFSKALAVWTDERCRDIAAALVAQTRARRLFFTHLTVLYALCAYGYQIISDEGSRCELPGAGADLQGTVLTANPG